MGLVVGFKDKDSAQLGLSLRLMCGARRPSSLCSW